MADYSVKFRTLAADAGWNAAALQEVFVKGLIELVVQEKSNNLSSFIST